MAVTRRRRRWKQRGPGGALGRVVGADGGVRPLRQQAGGHKFEEGSYGMLTDGSTLFKPCQDRARAEREAQFYEAAARAPALAPLRPFLPAYRGTCHVVMPDGTVRPCVALEDVTAGFRRPSVLDAKLGDHASRSDADPARRARASRIYAAQQRDGFRVAGMVVYRQATGCFAEVDRYFGRRSPPGSSGWLIQLFLDSGHLRLRTDVVEPVVEALGALADWARQPVPWRLPNASVLVVYEGDVPRVPASALKDDQVPAAPARVRVCLVDMARAAPVEPPAPDASTLRGLEALGAAFREAARVEAAASEAQDGV